MATLTEERNDLNSALLSAISASEKAYDLALNEQSVEASTLWAENESLLDELAEVMAFMYIPFFE